MQNSHDLRLGEGLTVRVTEHQDEGGRDTFIMLRVRGVNGGWEEHASLPTSMVPAILRVAALQRTIPDTTEATNALAAALAILVQTDPFTLARALSYAYAEGRKAGEIHVQGSMRQLLGLMTPGAGK